LKKGGYLVVEGPVGAGKTFLAGRLAEKLEGRQILEETSLNPFLPLFYRDRRKFGFQTQVSFLLARYMKQSRLTQQDLFSRVTISDFLFERGSIFARITLEGNELLLYEKLAAELSQGAREPDLVIYLQGSAPVLLDRINRFGRDFERDMDRKWLDELVDSYNSWFLRDRKYHVIVVNSDRVDFRRDDRALDALVDSISEHRGGITGFHPPEGGLLL
jgi:deoxyguanosine kinase